MRATYRVLAGLIVLGVVFQAAAVAFGTFGVINEIEGGAVVTADSDLPNAGPMLHGIGGMMVIPVLTLLLLIVSFFAKVRHGVRLALFLVLAVALQITLGFAAFEAPAVGLLHGVNAFVILALALHAVRAARAARTETAAAAETTGDAARV